jgi:hypothetical protein
VTGDRADTTASMLIRVGLGASAGAYQKGYPKDP